MRRVRITSTGPAQISDPDFGSLPAKSLSPRCGQVMRPYEGVWGPLLDDVVCGRPEGHNGRHRSVQALDMERSRRRWERYTRKRSERRRARRLAVVVSEAAEQARARAVGRLGHHAVPADPPPFDTEDQLSYGDPVAAGHDAGLPRLPRADFLDSVHIQHYIHTAWRLT